MTERTEITAFDIISRAADCTNLRRHRDFGGILLSTWNWATSPSRAMTDQEHAMCRRLARWCDAKIRKHGIRYQELSNGSRYPK